MIVHSFVRSIAYSFLYLAVGSIIILSITKLNRSTVPHCDETNWVALTKLYDVLVTRDFTNPYWTSFWGYDHPPLAKFVYGYLLAVKNNNFSATRNTLIEQYLPQDRTCKTTPVEPFLPYIWQMRSITTFLTIAVVALIVGVAGLATGTWLIPTVASLLIIGHPFMSFFVATTSDAFYIFFVLMAFLLFMRYLSRASLIALSGSGAMMGFSLLSKLSALAFIVPTVLFMVGRVFLPKLNKTYGIHIFVFMLPLVILWITINPAIWRHPISGTSAYYRQQIVSAEYQQAPYAQWKETSILARSLESYRKLYRFNGSFWENITVALRLVATGIGIFYCLARARGKSPVHTFLLFVSGMASIFVFITLLLPWDRYLLPVLTVLFIFQTIGVTAVYKQVDKRGQYFPSSS